MKKLFSLFFISFFLLLVLSPFLASAQEAVPRDTEIDYPILPGVPTPTSTISLPNYVKYVYIFALSAGGIVALVVLVLAGLKYTSSAGSPEKMKDAKDMISSAILGLLILLTSGIILRTVNPQLTVLREPEELLAILPDLSPGVYLCEGRVNIMNFWNTRRSAEAQEGKQRAASAQQLTGILKEIGKKCEGAGPLKTGVGGGIPETIEDKVTNVYLVPAYQEQQYGLILYEDSNYGGKAKVFFGEGGQGGSAQALEKPSEWSISDGFKASSARPFTLNPANPTWGAELFEGVRWNRDDLKGEMKEVPCNIGASKISAYCQLPKNKDGKNEVGSLTIEGSVFVIFLKTGSDWTTESEIRVELPTGNADLNNTPLGTWKPEECVEKREPELRDRYYPCAEKAVIISGKPY